MTIKFKINGQEVEAFQMTQHRRFHNDEWPSWMHEAWNKDVDEHNSLFIAGGDDISNEKNYIYLNKYGNITKASWNDYIVKSKKYDDFFIYSPSQIAKLVAESNAEGLRELELGDYDIEKSSKIDIFIKGTKIIICTFPLVRGTPVDPKSEAYAKRFVELHNAGCCDGGGN